MAMLLNLIAAHPLGTMLSVLAVTTASITSLPKPPAEFKLYPWFYDMTHALIPMATGALARKGVVLPDSATEVSQVTAIGTTTKEVQVTETHANPTHAG